MRPHGPDPADFMRMIVVGVVNPPSLSCQVAPHDSREHPGSNRRAEWTPIPTHDGTESRRASVWNGAPLSPSLCEVKGGPEQGRRPGRRATRSAFLFRGPVFFSAPALLLRGPLTLFFQALSSSGLTSGLLYIGVTTDPESRWAEHAAGKASRMTSDDPLQGVVYREPFATLGEARTRKCQLKRWTRAERETLVPGHIKELRRLSH